MYNKFDNLNVIQSFYTKEKNKTMFPDIIICNTKSFGGNEEEIRFAKYKFVEEMEGCDW